MHKGQLFTSVHWGNTKVSSEGTSLSGDGDDVFTYYLLLTSILKTETKCDLNLYWNGDLHGYGKENIDGYSVQFYPKVLRARRGTTANMTIIDSDPDINEEDNEPDLTETWDDDVLEEEEIKTRVYLPLINQ